MNGPVQVCSIRLQLFLSDLGDLATRVQHFFAKRSSREMLAKSGVGQGSGKSVDNCCLSSNLRPISSQLGSRKYVFRLDALQSNKRRHPVKCVRRVLDQLRDAHWPNDFAH